MTICGKVALITGATGALGSQIAKELVILGANVILVSRNSKKLANLKSYLESFIYSNQAIITIKADILSSHDRKLVYERASATAGLEGLRINILVNCAGIQIIDGFNGQNRGNSEVIDLNLIAAKEMIDLFLDNIKDDNPKHIVNIGSLAGYFTPMYYDIYGASKAGLVHLSKSLNAKFAAENKPIGVSVVSPGFVLEEGMFADLQKKCNHKVKLPFFLGSTTTDAVAKEVIRAIDRNVSEIIVNSMPIRPLLVLGIIFPKLEKKLAQWLGINSLMRQLANCQKQTES